MNEHLYSVIMAGGIGSRLWPRSRTTSPKQFLDLLGTETMLQQTIDRIRPLIPLSRIFVVGGEEYLPTVLDQVPGFPPENMIVEPGPRGTAPCIGLAAVALRQRDPQATMAVFPADHRIADAAAFRQAIDAAGRVAQDEYLITLGIAPQYPHTGYGYIQRGAALDHAGGLEVFAVKRFAEKPDRATAEQFVESGDYYWNGGIFIWRADVILREMARLLPDLNAHLCSIADAWQTPHKNEALMTAWRSVPRVTIDYGIMENASRVAVIPVDLGWDDVGNWATLSSHVPGDDEGNAVRGAGKTLLLETSDTYVYTSSGRLVATIGLEDFIVVDTPDAILICPKDQAESVRDVVAALKSEHRADYL